MVWVVAWDMDGLSCWWPFFRELLGSGSVFGFKVFEAIGWATFPANGLMVDSIGAFLILGLIIWVQRSRNGYVEQQ